MERKAEPLKNIEARIQELENSIHEREKQLRERAGRLKKELQEELAPAELVKKYPLQTTGLSLLFGFFTGKIIRSIISPSRRTDAQPASPPQKEPSELKNAVASIGVDVLRSGKDLAFNYLKHYMDKKMKAGEGK